MTAEFQQFKKLTAKAYMAFFIRHEVSQFMTFDEALPFVQRSVNAWTISQFEQFVIEMDLKDENPNRHSVSARA